MKICAPPYMLIYINLEIPSGILTRCIFFMERDTTKFKTGRRIGGKNFPRFMSLSRIFFQVGAPQVDFCVRVTYRGKKSQMHNNAIKKKCLKSTHFRSKKEHFLTAVKKKKKKRGAKGYRTCACTLEHSLPV